MVLTETIFKLFLKTCAHISQRCLALILVFLYLCIKNLEGAVLQYPSLKYTFVKLHDLG